MAKKAVSQKQLTAAIQDLGIDVPILSANYGKDGVINIITRDGLLTWSPPKKATTKKTTKTNTAPVELEK